MKVLMKGNEAINEAAIRGTRAFFGYPITPQKDTRIYELSNAPSGRRFYSVRKRSRAINMV